MLLKESDLRRIVRSVIKEQNSVPVLDDKEQKIANDIISAVLQAKKSTVLESSFKDDIKDIGSSIVDIGFRLFDESGNIYLYMKDDLGNSGDFKVFDSVPTGIVNKCVLTVDRDNGSRSYINGKQNMFQNDSTSVIGSLSSPQTGLKALHSSSSEVFGNQIFLDSIGYTKKILNNSEIIALQSGSQAASDIDQGGIIINLSEGTGEIKDFSDSYQGSLTQFTNQITESSKTIIGEQDGTGNFSFFIVEGTNMKNGSLTKIADAPQYNKTGVIEIGVYEGYDYMSGYVDNSRNSQVPRISLSNKYAVMGYPDMSNEQVEIYDLESKSVLTVLTGTEVIPGLPSNHNFGEAVAINNSGDLFISDPDGDDPDGSSIAGHIHYFRESSPGSFTLQQTITGHSGLFNGILPAGTGSPYRKQLGKDTMKATNSHLFCRYGTVDDDRGHVAAFKIVGEGATREIVPYGLLSQSGDGTGDHIVFGVRSGLYFDHVDNDDYGRSIAANDNFCLVNSKFKKIFFSPGNCSIVFVF